MGGGRELAQQYSHLPILSYLPPPGLTPASRRVSKFELLSFRSARLAFILQHVNHMHSSEVPGRQVAQHTVRCGCSAQGPRQTRTSAGFAARGCLALVVLTCDKSLCEVKICLRWQAQLGLRDRALGTPTYRCSNSRPVSRARMAVVRPVAYLHAGQTEQRRRYDAGASPCRCVSSETM